MFTLNFTAVAHFKQVGTVATKDWVSCGMFKKNPDWNISQVNKLIGNS